MEFPMLLACSPSIRVVNVWSAWKSKTTPIVAETVSATRAFSLVNVNVGAADAP